MTASYGATRAQLISVALCLVTVLSACKHVPPPATPQKPRVLTLAVISSPELNPDPRGRPSPVVVRLYQLSSTADFSNAEFSALYPNDTSILAKTLLSKQEFTVFPGEHSTVAVEFANEARWLGVLVAYNDIDHASWRLIDAAQSGSLTLSLNAKSAQLQPRP